MNISDIIVVAILLLFIILGSTKGLMLSVFSLGTYIIAIIAAIKLASPVAKLLEKTALFANLKDKVTGFLNNIISNFVNDTVEAQVDGIVSSLKLNNAMQESIGIQDIKERSSTTAGMVDTLGGKISDLILLVIAFVVVYIIARILLSIIYRIIKKTSKLPVVRSFDKLGGVFFGLLEGILVIWVIFMILFMFRASDLLAPVFESINNSKIALLLYRNNVLLTLVSNYIAGIRL